MKLYLQRVYLNRDGYDRYGAYWGTGGKVFVYQTQDAKLFGHIRSSDRHAAKQMLKNKYGEVSFYH